MPNKRRRLMGSMVLAAVTSSLSGHLALGSEELVETVGAWIVTCHQTEAGGRACAVRNDEDGKPALAQDALFSLTLHDGKNEAEGLVRIADLELPPRVEVEIMFGDQAISIEGVGRRGRLAARFSLPKQRLRGLANAAAVRVRFADRQGQTHEIMFPFERIRGSAGHRDRLPVVTPAASRPVLSTTRTRECLAGSRSVVRHEPCRNPPAGAQRSRRDARLRHSG